MRFENNYTYRHSSAPETQGEPFRVCFAREGEQVPLFAIIKYLRQIRGGIYFLISNPPHNLSEIRTAGSRETVSRIFEEGGELRKYSHDNFTLFVSRGVVYTIDPNRNSELIILVMKTYPMQIVRGSSRPVRVSDSSFDSKLYIDSRVFYDDRVNYSALHHYINKHFIPNTVRRGGNVEIRRNIMDSFCKEASYVMQHNSIAATKRFHSTIAKYITSNTEVVEEVTPEPAEEVQTGQGPFTPGTSSPQPADDHELNSLSAAINQYDVMGRERLNADQRIHLADLEARYALRMVEVQQLVQAEQERQVRVAEDLHAGRTTRRRGVNINVVDDSINIVDDTVPTPESEDGETLSFSF